MSKIGGTYNVDIRIFENTVINGLRHEVPEDMDGIAAGNYNLSDDKIKFSGLSIYKNYVENFANCGIHITNGWENGCAVDFNIVKECGTLAAGCQEVIKAVNGTKVYNNTVYLTLHGYGIVVRRYSTPSVTIKNNIIYADIINKGKPPVLLMVFD